MSLHPYVPQDRLRALALGQELPERVQGTVLFADIAGFTRLTEALTQRLGERRGVEAVSLRISAVYEALIGEVERQGGSVIGFAGDAITCWFDAATPGARRESAQRAAQCAQAMQTALLSFSDLSVKVALASGAARRFAVGDAAVQRIDVLAGSTLDRMAQAEHLAQPGEVVLDAATCTLLELAEGEGTERDEGGDGSARVRLLPASWAARLPALPPIPAGSPAAVPAERLRPWVLRFVQEREAAGAQLFATDLRPAAALFLRFGGLDYDADEQAPARLDALVTQTQHLLQLHGGVLLELTVGDKGSYCYASFGAARVHEDDAPRAVRAAMALRDAFEGTPTQFGLSFGLLRVGPYGSQSRHSFGAMGDDTNAAARLMQLARPGEILVSARVQQAVAQAFVLEARAPISLKGKAEPLPVFAVLEARQQRAIRLQEPSYALPMVGREPELELIQRGLERAATGVGQLICVSAEAGMGKSRLIAEGIRLARRKGFQGYGGGCAGHGVATAYRVWQDVWLALFNLDASLPQRRLIRQLGAELAMHAPEHADAWPLLGSVLGVELPDNEFTQALQPKDRKALLEKVLLQCWDSVAREALDDGAGLLLVIEELHGIDALSLDLLLLLSRAAAELPVLVLLSQRPAQASPASTPLQAQMQAQLQQLLALPHAQSLELDPLAGSQAALLIRAKLASLFPERSTAVPVALIERITQRAQGNPFYVEQLLNYLHDRGLDPHQLKSLEQLDLPASLHSLVLSRIDQLGRSQQMALKVASIVGRVFRAADLSGYYPELGEVPSVMADLRELDRLGFTPQEMTAPELTYLFKHLVMLEVDYESIPYATRVQLHGLYARYLEARHADQLEPLAATLAHHYSLAEQRDKALGYLVQAGIQAAGRFANEEALACFGRALSWLPVGADEQRFEILLRREALFDLLGRHEEQLVDLAELNRLADRLPGSALKRAGVAIRRAKLNFDQGDYAAARNSCEQTTQALSGLAGGEELLADALLVQARALIHIGATQEARRLLDAALALARTHGYRRGEYNTLARLAELHWQQGDYGQAEALWSHALQLTREARDLRREIDMLSNLGVVAKTSGRFALGIERYEQAQKLARRIGDRLAEGSLAINIGSACLVLGQFEQAVQHGEQAAGLFAEVNEPAQQGLALNNWAEALRRLGQSRAGLALAQRALAMFRACGFRRGELIALENLGQLEWALGQASLARLTLADAVARAAEIGMRSIEASAQLRLGEMLLALGQLDAAQQALLAAQPLLQDLGDPLPLLELQVAQALLAMARGEAALPLIEAPLAALLQPPPSLPWLPLSLHAAAHRVLAAAGDTRASRVLALARAELQTRAARITRNELRSDFLALPEHRELLEPAA